MNHETYLASKNFFDIEAPTDPSEANFSREQREESEGERGASGERKRREKEGKCIGKRDDVAR